DPRTPGAAGPAAPAAPTREACRRTAAPPPGARVTTTNSPTTPGPAPGRERGDAPRAAAPRRRARTTDRGLNRVFRWTATGAGGLILGVLAAVAIFLVLRAWPALAAGGDVLGEGVAWFPAGATAGAFVGPAACGPLRAAAVPAVPARPAARGR